MRKDSGMIEAAKLCDLAWKLYCRQFPDFVQSMKPETLEMFKSAWTVGYYFSLNSGFKPIRKKIRQLLYEKWSKRGLLAWVRSRL